MTDASNLLVWRHTLAGIKHAGGSSDNSRPNPVIAGQRLLVCTFSPGAVYCLEIADGSEIWSFPLDYLGHSSVLPSGDLVYAATSRTLHALRLADGQLVWKFTPHAGSGEYMYSSPVLAGGRVFIGDRAGEIHCLDASTGARLWTSAVAKGNVNSTFLVVGERIIAATNDASVVCVDADGFVVWNTQVDGPAGDEVLPYEGALVKTASRTNWHTGGSLWLINPVDGVVLNHWEWPGERVDEVAVAEDMLVVRLGGDLLIGLRKDQELYRQSYPEVRGSLSYSATTRCVYEAGTASIRILNPTTGECLYGWQYDELARLCGFPDLLTGREIFACWPAGTHPAVTAEHIYLLTEGGHVVALRHPQIR